MTDEMRIQTAEEALLQHLKDAGQPLSTEDLDHWRRSCGVPVSTTDVQGATWNLVRRGKARFTSERLLAAL
jgi:hypothetical protein